MYFYLDKDCFFIPGKCNGALYDTLDGNVYCLDKDETELLKKSEAGMIIDHLDQTIFKELELMKLGFFCENKCFVEKNRLYNTYLFKRRDLFSLQINSVYIKLNNICNGNCKWCNKIYCQVCNLTNNEAEEMDFEKWIEVIDYLININLKKIYFTGGDPLLYKNLDKLIKYVKSKDLEVSLITNGLNNVPKDLPMDISIVLTIYENRDLDEILPKFSNFEKITVLSSQQEMIDILKSKEKDNLQIYKTKIDNYIDRKEQLKPVTLDKIYFKRDFDICLIGKLYIDNLGNVVPCLTGIKEKLGNIIFENKDKVTKKVVEEIWYKPKVNNKCSNCELYFSCPTCRYYNSKSNCKYDVDNGEWRS